MRFHSELERRTVARMSFSEVPEFSIRPASEEDLPAVLAIERQVYALPWTEDAFRVELQKSYASFLVLTDDETDSKIGGYIVYWMLFEECHVLNVATHLEWRGLGLGLRLMRHVINQALRKELQRVFLEVRKSNVAAIAMYQKLGFFIDHVKKGFYEDGEEAYFMVLFLNRPNQF